MEIRFNFDDTSDEKMSYSNPSPQYIIPEQTKDLQLINIIKTSSYNRPPAIDPENN